MSADPRRLKLVDLCRLLNSTPLGEVIQEHQLKNHRNRAGLRIGDNRRIDLVRYVAWLVAERHKPKAATTAPVADDTSLLANAQGAAALVARSAKKRRVLSPKQEIGVAALLSSRTYAEAAEKAGVGVATIYRWLKLPKFRAAFRVARRELSESAFARMQAIASEAVETLFNVAKFGRRDSDRVRAAATILNNAFRGLESAELLHGEKAAYETKEFVLGDVVQLLSTRLRQVDRSELPAAEKARLTSMIAESLLRAYGIEVLDQRTEALETVLLGRKEKKPA
jgi:hypothetical protein